MLQKLTNADMFESFIDLSETNKFGVNSQERMNKIMKCSASVNYVQ